MLRALQHISHYLCHSHFSSAISPCRLTGNSSLNGPGGVSGASCGPLGPLGPFELLCCFVLLGCVFFPLPPHPLAHWHLNRLKYSLIKSRIPSNQSRDHDWSTRTMAMVQSTTTMASAAAHAPPNVALTTNPMRPPTPRSPSHGFPNAQC